MALTCEARHNYPMGLGLIGSGNAIFKRKFRWTMEIQYCENNTVPENFVKVGARPQIDFDEVEINYLHGKMFIPGKGTWQTMTVTYYDVAGPAGSVGDTNSALYSWIASVYDITDPVNLHMGNTIGNYAGTARIYLYDGCGNAVECWILQNVWPQSINFGELDMSSSDECTIEMTMRYTGVQYTSFCPPGAISPCSCTPCESLSVAPDLADANLYE